MLRGGENWTGVAFGSTVVVVVRANNATNAVFSVVTIALGKGAEDAGSVVDFAVATLGKDNKCIVAVVTSCKRICTFDAATGEKISSVGLSRRPSSLALQETERSGVPPCAIVSDKAGDVVAYTLPDVSKGKKYLFTHTASPVLALALKDGMLVSGDRDEKVRVSSWPETCHVRAYCLGHAKYVSFVGIASGDRIVSGSGDGKLNLWNASSGALVSTLECQATPPLSLSVNSGGNMVASMWTGDRTRIAIHDLGDGKQDAIARRTVECTSSVHAFCFAGNTLLAITATSEGAIDRIVAYENDLTPMPLSPALEALESAAKSTFGTASVGSVDESSKVEEEACLERARVRRKVDGESTEK